MNTLTDHLRIAALPLDIKWADKEANLAAVEQAMKSLPRGTDIVVLPELFSTGFTDDEELLRELAETNTGKTIERLKSLAAQYSVAFAGSFAARTAPHVYNRGFFIEPSGEETFYDKRHLFSLSSEIKVFEKGRDPLKIVRFRGWNIALIVCYDLRFPVWCRTRRNHYDLLVVVANWPQARAYAFEHLLIARAIENQCCVVGANRSGKDFYGIYDDMTMIYDCRGTSVSRPCGPFIIADLSKKKQEEYRQSFPVSNDADDFALLD